VLFQIFVDVLEASKLNKEITHSSGMSTFSRHGLIRQDSHLLIKRVEHYCLVQYLSIGQNHEMSLSNSSITVSDPTHAFFGFSPRLGVRLLAHHWKAFDLSQKGTPAVADSS
jgi:hypothetical protein